MARPPPSSGSRIRRRSPRRGEVAELDFNDDRPPPRAGDPVSEEVLDRTQPRRRVRQAGLTGAAVERAVTADDLSPETLIDEDGAESSVHRASFAADTSLRRVSAREVFGPPLDRPSPRRPPRSKR